MLPAPGGTFRMGCVSRKSCQRDEKPLRSVTIKPFEVGEYEVTFNKPGGLRSASRRRIYAGTRNGSRGFRVARTLEE